MKEKKENNIKEAKDAVEENKQNNVEEKNNKTINIIKSKKRMIFVIIVSIITAIVGYVVYRGTYLETLEIGENYINVFSQNLKYITILLITNFLIVFLLFYLTNRQIKNGLKEFFEHENKKMPKLLNKSISFVIAIIVSIIISNYSLEKVMLFISNTQFGKVDSIFGLDIGYFMFQKPFVEFILWYVLIAIVASTIYSVVYYIISFNYFFDGIDRKVLKNSKLVKQLERNIMFLGILIACLLFVNTQNIGTEKFISIEDGNLSYYLYGAGYADVTIKLWGYRILCIAMVLSVYAAIKAFKNGKTKRMIMYILVVPSYLIVLSLTLVIFQVTFVEPFELDRQEDYIKENINNTKDAYGIITEEISLEMPRTIQSSDIILNEDIINNIAIVSKDITLKDLNSTENAKGYYSYRTSQIGKYNIDGKDTLVYVTPREISSNIGTYNGKTYEYTHGYSAILTAVSNMDEDGTINHIQKSFNNTNEKITITEPRIYYGLETNETVVVNIKEKSEFDYPILDSNKIENKENVYNGLAGLNLNFIDRIILGIKEGDLKLALSSNINSQSKILTNRNIIKRAKTIMPYLMYDENPYLVINDEGKLIWVLDGYTTSNAYPYSQKTLIKQTATNKLEINYIRNSIKVLIDAYNGTIKFYITDRSDPIAMAYYKLYPDLFVDKDETIPSDISEHFVYPEFLYKIQSEIITRYHNVEPSVLYRGEDIWEFATHNTGRIITNTGKDIEAYYTLLKENNNEKSKLTLLVPYTPNGKHNLISYLSAGYDENGNSILKIYKYPNDSNIIGPMQLDTQIEQDSNISEQLQTLNVNGTKIVKNMIIIPFKDSILYVEPIYQQYLNETSLNSTNLVLRKVIVASGNKVAIGDNFKEAMANLISRYAIDIEIQETDNIEDLINAIIKANNNLSNSNNSNDWSMIGKDIEKLQQLINKLQILVEKQEENKNEETTNKEVDTYTNVIVENII